MILTKRLSFRPRPVDINKKLSLITCQEDLDDGRACSSSTPEPVIVKKAAGGSEIPTPQFLVVDSYEKDYTPTFKQPQSYIRARPARSEATNYCEYDLDDDDEDWINKYNGGGRILLASEKFEMMMYKLEICDYHKGLLDDKDRLGPEFGVPTPIHLTPAEANEIAREFADADESERGSLRKIGNALKVFAAVYDYWKNKRIKAKKPILRRLQPAPPVNDSSPFNVFRPREKLQRPHSRRSMQRRENDSPSFKKLRKVRDHFAESKEILGLIHKREKIKRDLVQVESNMQRLDMEVEIIRSQVDAKRNLSSSNSPRIEDPQPLPFFKEHPLGQSTSTSPDRYPIPVAGIRMKRRYFPVARNLLRTRASAKQEPLFLFTEPLDVGKLKKVGIELSFEDGPIAHRLPGRIPGRIGRGGRLVFDRSSTAF